MGCGTNGELPIPTVEFVRRIYSCVSVEQLRSLRIVVRLRLCFAAIISILLLGAVPAIWQFNLYNKQVKKLSAIDRRMISVLKVNNQVLAYREVMQNSALGNDAGKIRQILTPFRESFLKQVQEASNALRDYEGPDESRSRAIYTLLAYQTAIPGEIDGTLELAGLQDWQAIHYRLDKQMLNTHRVLGSIVSEIEAEANAERDTTLRTMTEIRSTMTGIFPMCLAIVLIAFGVVIGAYVAQSIADPLRELEAGAEQLGAGNFSHRVSVGGKDELATVSLAFNKAAEQIEHLHTGLEALVAERTTDLRLANETLRQLSSKDPLTGIANRRIFNERLQTALERAIETRSAVSLLMVDIDHFKALNDNFGHQRGDECLIQVVRTIESVPLRTEDLIARYGGEEFAVILTGTDTTGAERVAERMRSAVHDLAIPNPGSPVLGRVSISIGIATVWPKSTVPIDQLIEKSDRALYRAKQNGRNLICAA